MARLFFHFEFFLACCFMGTSRTVLPPQNLTLDFEEGRPRVSWDPSPDFVEGCRYSVMFTGKGADYPKYQDATSPLTDRIVEVNEGFLNVSAKIVCNSGTSKTVSVTIENPELVTGLDCAIISSSLTRCSWKPTDKAPPDLGFFYSLEYANHPNPKSLPTLRECPSYIHTNGVRTGCELQVDTNQSINILFNGTVNTMVVRKTKEFLFITVRAPPLNWTVEKTKDKFHIRWTPPDFPQFTWKYNISYSRCDQTTKYLEREGTSALLNRDSACPYNIAVKAEAKGKGATEWTAQKHFDADRAEWNPMLFAVILIPLTLAVLAVLTLLCCVKNKEKIFPEIPQPRDFVSDILDNNNKIGVYDLYLPNKEDECHITLVMDPLLNKPQF